MFKYASVITGKSSKSKKYLKGLQYTVYSQNRFSPQTSTGKTKFTLNKNTCYITSTYVCLLVYSLLKEYRLVLSWVLLKINTIV